MAHNTPEYLGIESNTPFLGRCKACDFVLFSTTVGHAESWEDVRQVGVAYQFNNGFVGRCPNGHKAFQMKEVKGTYSADHKCDSRCLNAKGHTCTCSCGGANHGRGYAVEVTSVDREPGFIGEVGKHIRGTATVVGKREVRNGATMLYTFLTQKGDTIKWFVPSYADPSFDERQEVSFRAKVKDHADDRFGKATIVTYLEEVE